ncbi:ribosomal RNA-processing protein 8 [Toxorhynchites rutilus septentrionalis]|uniref:ribosomal RNA-processing protein 8 n=1 Tax=Toxorhynchites rutilus septentrionalis TaxID=329112 RepID=UPI00247A2CF1|nr:ribosomal RNA-processing protein 8 [Toxorhynchites rutilus septentrionalis]
MKKVFTEPDWDDDELSANNHKDYSFAKIKVTKNKHKEHLESEKSGDSFQPGKFVRAPQANGKVEQPHSPPKDKCKPSKRKADIAIEKLESGTAKAKKLKQKKRENHVHDTKAGQTRNVKQSNNAPANLRDKLVESLKGSRFRFLNEQMYKTTGDEARKLFSQDPSAFQAYHEGYRHQIVQWSMNPLNRIIKNIQKLAQDQIIADFGCGEARLAESVPHKVYSLDLVAHNESVIVCDMANTPLENNSINVVVFCLSLMGTNVRDFLLEANRVLKVGGSLRIAEVSSRFDDVKQFIDCVQKCGFLVVNKDLKHKLFYFFNFKKVRTVDKHSAQGKHFSLKPCLYKKR